MASDGAADGGGGWRAVAAVAAWFRRARAPEAEAPSCFFDLSARDLDSGEPVPFSRYDGCVCLVVNVASR